MRTWCFALAVFAALVSIFFLTLAPPEAATVENVFLEDDVGTAVVLNDCADAPFDLQSLSASEVADPDDDSFVAGEYLWTSTVDFDVKPATLSDDEEEGRRRVLFCPLAIG